MSARTHSFIVTGGFLGFTERYRTGRYRIIQSTSFMGGIFCFISAIFKFRHLIYLNLQSVESNSREDAKKGIQNLHP